MASLAAGPAYSDTSRWVDRGERRAGCIVTGRRTRSGIDIFTGGRTMPDRIPGGQSRHRVTRSFPRPYGEAVGGSSRLLVHRYGRGVTGGRYRGGQRRVLWRSARHVARIRVRSGERSSSPANTITARAAATARVRLPVQRRADSGARRGRSRVWMAGQRSKSSGTASSAARWIRWVIGSWWVTVVLPSNKAQGRRSDRSRAVRGKAARAAAARAAARGRCAAAT